MDAPRQFAFAACLCAVLLAAGVQARSVDAAQAERAARAWLARGAAPAQIAGRPVAAVTTRTDGAARMHVAKMAGGGYVVLSADDRIAPIIAFADSGDLPAPDARHPLWALLTQDLACRAAAAEGDADTGAARRLLGATASRTPEQRRWDALLNASGGTTLLAASKPSVPDPRVDSLVATRWDQGAVGNQNVYNYYTPGNYPCGCVATATAQVMKYFAWPKGAVSDLSFDECEVDGVKTTCTMKGGVYDWDAMPDVPAAGITATQAEAIGKLTYDIGCAVWMSWGAQGSSASIFSSRLRLLDTFRYKSCEGVRFLDGSFPYTLARCKQVVIPCLDYRSPVVMSISGNVGHAVVVDGYGYAGDDFYMHINCGWGGSGDAWYCPPDLSMGNYAFTAIEGFVFHILPQGTGTLVSGRVLDDEGTPIAGAEVTLKQGSVVKARAETDVRGIYAVLVPKAGTYTLIAAHGAAAATQTVAVVANNSNQLTEDGGWLPGYTPTIGNTYTNNFQLAAVATETSTTADVPVPYAWLDRYYPGQGASSADYETLGNAVAANGLSVWQCYLAGLDPTNAASCLRVSIRMENGAPVVTWSPVSPVSEGLGYIYRVRGRADLGEALWAPTNAATRFFKVFLEKK